MASVFSATDEVLDPILVGVVTGNQDKVIAWLQNQPGAWGFLSGQAGTAVSDYAGRKLDDTERRLVWSRMWWWLVNVRAGIDAQP